MTELFILPWDPSGWRGGLAAAALWLGRGAGCTPPGNAGGGHGHDNTFKHVMDWGLGFIPNSAMYGAESVPCDYGHHASRRTFGHSGYRSSVGFADPEQGLAVALVFNGTPSNEDHERRIRTVLDALYEDLGRGPASG